MSERSVEDLLAHAGWLRALAFRIVRDDDVADDLVQDTFVATLRRPPERDGSTKSWLAKVLLNRLRMRARSEGRRTAREQATLLIDDSDVPAQDMLVARAEIQRRLVELVLRLDEPYRATVLLHFCEGVALAQIARTQGVPASTVRWRLKTALDQLRAELDRETGGRKQWAIPLLAMPKGVLVAQKTTKLVVIAIIVLLLLAGGILLLRGRDRSDDAIPRSATSSGTPTLTAGAVPIALGADPNRPAWLIQADIKPRRIAGRVTFRGAPVAGATVELASLATESGLGTPAQRTTNAAGAFDFGSQPAMAFSVRATARERASASLSVDLRNPLLRPEQLELALGACDAAMIGTVRDASGGVIANARIARLDLDSHVPGGPTVLTDERGAYELCAETIWPPEVTVEVSAAGYGTIVHTALVPGRVKTDFALVPEATIVGRVIRDDTREPVAHAFVYVPAGPPGVQRTGWRAAFSDANGQFRIDRVAPGRHLVFAGAEGLANTPRGTPVAVEAGQVSAELEIRLEAGSTIRGKVVDGDKPIGGARIAAHGRNAYSQDDGSFVLTGVPRGDIKFSALPYEVVKPEIFKATQPLHDGVELEVAPLGTITGRVVRGRDPVPGAALYLNGPNDYEIDRVFTGADGRFIARGLRAGPWEVAAGSQQLGAFGTAPKIVQLARGKTEDVTIDMVYGASISGRVVDQTGAPVPGVTVAFMHTGANDMGMSATAMDGSFRAATMTGGGKYRAEVSTVATIGPRRTPLRPATGTEFPLVTLADGNSEVTGVVLAVKLERFAISGIVVDADGAPVPDARVIAELAEGDSEPRFYQGLQSPTSTTDADGRFTIDELLSGTYALRARAPAGLDGTLLGVRAGSSGNRVVLPAAGAIDATIIGFAEPPQVTAVPTAMNRASAPILATLQGNLATLRNLSPGSYIVSARTRTEAASAIVEVAGRRTARVTLTSKGAGQVSGRVRDFRSGQPVEGSTCRAVPRVGITPAPAGRFEGVRTDARGEFSLDAPIGDIAVICDGLWSQFSEGMRMITVSPAQRVQIDVPVVAPKERVWTTASLGAELDRSVLIPRLARVQARGPAAAAGLANGDVIVAVDGASVAELSPGGAWLLIVNRAPGSTAKLSVTRGGKPITADVVLGPAD
jgi:RNA polymerase sigma factor (sigma-70 family)